MITELQICDVCLSEAFLLHTVVNGCDHFLCDYCLRELKAFDECMGDEWRLVTDSEDFHYFYDPDSYFNSIKDWPPEDIPPDIDILHYGGCWPGKDTWRESWANIPPSLLHPEKGAIHGYEREIEEL